MKWGGGGKEFSMAEARWKGKRRLSADSLEDHRWKKDYEEQQCEQGGRVRGGEVQEGEIWSIFMAEDEVKPLREGIETPSKKEKVRSTNLGSR